MIPGIVRLEVIDRLVCHTFGLTAAELVADRRTQRLAVPRHVAFWLARRYTTHSLPAIGRHYNRDHTSVMYGCKSLACRRAHDPELDAACWRLQLEIESQAGPGLPVPAVTPLAYARLAAGIAMLADALNLLRGELRALQARDAGNGEDHGGNGADQ